MDFGFLANLARGMGNFFQPAENSLSTTLSQFLPSANYSSNLLSPAKAPNLNLPEDQQTITAGQKLTPQQIQAMPFTDLGYRPNSNVTPTPMIAPNTGLAQAAIGQSPDSGFRFSLGQPDYATYSGQLQNMFGNEPLASYIPDFIASANKYGMDPRALALLGQLESSGGKNYPTQSFNPFGYNAGSGGLIRGPDGKMYVNTDQGLMNAGFNSVPQAIDLLTKRLATNQFPGYVNFRQNPTLASLQQAYNATPAEQANYLNTGGALIDQFFR